MAVNNKLSLLSQWLTGFKLLGIPYLVGKNSGVQTAFFQGPFRTAIRESRKNPVGLVGLVGFSTWVLNQK